MKSSSEGSTEEFDSRLERVLQELESSAIEFEWGAEVLKNDVRVLDPSRFPYSFEHFIASIEAL